LLPERVAFASFAMLRAYHKPAGICGLTNVAVLQYHNLLIQTIFPESASEKEAVFPAGRFIGGS
ncbi:hypothetical protein, partial [Klebsiella quasipneumoniae]|uniref:hypothetical protein n=1 Tax=Klebsiella quasipneumoniae TaxID=1463165 RepID=UPI001BD946CF